MFNSQIEARQARIDEIFDSIFEDVGNIIDDYQFTADEEGLNLAIEIKAPVLDGNSIQLTIIDREAQRREWITKMVQRFNKDRNARLMATSEVRVVDIRITTHEKNRPYFVSRAVCKAGDNFDLDTGIAVAYAHAMDEEVPDLI